MAGYGRVRWTLISEDGTHIDLLVPCHHVPASTVRLLSLQNFCRSNTFDRSTDQFGGNSNYFWMHATHQRTRFQCPIDPRSNLPVALAKIPCHRGGCKPELINEQAQEHPCSSCQRHSVASLSILEESNQNITTAQKELLLWHFCLGHLSFAHLQQLMLFRLGHLSFAHLQQLMRPRTIQDVEHTDSEDSIKSKPKNAITVDPCIFPKNPSTRTCQPPLCAACQIARAKKRPTEVSTTTIPREALLKIKDLAPGARVSVDQYESSVRGRLATSKGKESFGHKYGGGTIFCDHATGYIQCYHQVSLRATDTVTPQFHVVYDEHFSTVHSLEEDNPTWIELFISERDYYGPDEDKEESNTITFPEADPTWTPISEVKSPNIPEDIPTGPTEYSEHPTIEDDDDNTTVHQDSDDHPLSDDIDHARRVRFTVESIHEPSRPQRTRKPNKLVFGDEWVNHTVQLTPTSRTMLGHIIPDLTHDDLFLHSLDWDAPPSDNFTPYHALNLLHVDPYTEEVKWTHPFTLGAKATNEDTPTLRNIQRMTPAEIDSWYDAMDIELEALRNKNTFIEIDRATVPAGHQIIKSTWAFRRKRRPNGEIHKLKARFVVWGDLQILEESEHTYSPVVDWSTVRLLFILTVAQQLKSTTIDFNAAFVQSDLPAPIYLELPPGYGVPGADKVYKVSKSLYGDVRAAKLWYKHLSSALVNKMGFTKSTIDSCLYFRDQLVFVFYVDDGIIVSRDDTQAQLFINELRACHFDLGVEEDYAGYLGVDIIPQSDGTLLLSQTGLIERILTDFGLTDSTSSKLTPAAEILGPHKDAAPFNDAYNYRSVIRKIGYLASNTRLEVSLANHQYARFSNDPRTPHGVALKRIGRYLLGTRDKGMIVRPTKYLTLDCYADADFAGLFPTSDPNDPKSVKSRSGFIITLGTIPVA